MLRVYNDGVVSIGYQILKKMKHLLTFRILRTPPLGWGGGPEIVGIWEKKWLDSWYLRSQKSVFGPAEGRKF